MLQTKTSMELRKQQRRNQVNEVKFEGKSDSEDEIRSN